MIVSGHRVKFTSNAMLARSQETGVRSHVIAPGKLMLNGNGEPGNSEIGDKLLNETLFFSLDPADSVSVASEPDDNAA